jgi:hypothetical protein
MTYPAPLPSPFNEPDWKSFGMKLVRYLSNQQQGAQPLQAVQLMHQTGGEKPSVDGILMFDPTVPGVVVSVGGAWATFGNTVDLSGVLADIAALQGDVSALQGDVSALQGDVIAAEADIAVLQTETAALRSALFEEALDREDADMAIWSRVLAQEARTWP